ncbi:MAG: hypothetical protein KY468_04255 [Armatimonadetes bacterium]|nr:hypothetical protein [Armatimonadota bacterium]
MKKRLLLATAALAAGLFAALTVGNGIPVGFSTPANRMKVHLNRRYMVGGSIACGSCTTETSHIGYVSVTFSTCPQPLPFVLPPRP